jgi:hypothetical protein
MRPRVLMAELDGREYVPGGAAEMDELLDLFGIWAEQQEQRQQRGTGIDPSMLMDDD